MLSETEEGFIGEHKSTTAAMPGLACSLLACQPCLAGPPQAL